MLKQLPGQLLKYFFVILFLHALGFEICFVATANAQSKIFLDIGSAKLRKSKLAIPPFQSTGVAPNTTAERTGLELFSVIKNDLDVTGLFTELPISAYLEKTDEVGLRPIGVSPDGFDFGKWSPLETEFLIRGGYQILNGVLFLEIYAYYVPQGKLILGKKYEGAISTVRKIGHTFANDFIKSVTGKPTFFKSQIVVTIDNGPQTNREVYISDWDGHNLTAITDHKTITVSPAWSRDGEHIAYTAFVKRKIGKGSVKRNPDLFLYEVKSRRRWLVSYRDGLNSGAEFLPDGKHLLATLSIPTAGRSRTADIYKMTLDGKSIQPLTQGPGSAMNVEPAVSPDGKTLAFSSDRGGKPMIYTMPLSGGPAKMRISIGHYNSTPSWSPDNKTLAFAGFDKEKNNFDIFIMNIDGSEIKRLTSAKKSSGKWANNEDPAFAPDGRQIMFVSDRAGTRQLYLVNIDGSNERQITYDNKFYGKPKWGPLVE